MAGHDEKGLKKRGRPKSDKPARDLGTPELRFKRMALVKGGDPALAEHPIGVLFALGWCSQSEYDAAVDFGVTWGKVFNPSFARNLLAAFLPTGFASEWSDDDLAEAEQKLKAIRAAMNSRQCYDALVNCVVYRRVDERRIKKLKYALEVLVSAGRQQRRAT